MRKSVSFTPDTKKEDTFSAQTLIANWEAAEEAFEALTKELTEQPASPSKPAKEPEVKKEKKEKKQKKPKASSESTVDEAVGSTSKETPNYVKYLEQFTNDKTNWKFNKNRQNDLFKNLFDVDRIPSNHNSSLIQYVSSTQGQARQRIAEQAEEVLKAIWVRENEDADLMSLDTPEARRAAYFEALATSIQRYEQSGAGRTQYGDQQLKAILREHEQGHRAEQMLSKALEDELSSEPSSMPANSTTSTTHSTTKPAPTSKGIPGATRIIETQKTYVPNQIAQTTTKEIDITPRHKSDSKRKRTRKSRTTDVSSSSEDSSSDDNSSSDASDDAPIPPPTPKENPPEEIFDSDVLDKKFGSKPLAEADKKQAKRSFDDYTHGNNNNAADDESDSE